MGAGHDPLCRNSKLAQIVDKGKLNHGDFRGPSVGPCT